MAGPRATSPWLDGAGAPEHPPLDGDVRTQVAVVGGGIAGLTVAATTMIDPTAATK